MKNVENFIDRIIEKRREPKSKRKKKQQNEKSIKTTKKKTKICERNYTNRKLNFAELPVLLL